jgi:hypothetical protein
MKDTIEWKKEVKNYNSNFNQLLESNSNFKDLYYGFEVIDGKIIDNPSILFIGINPGKGNGKYGKDILETNQVSYLDIFDENYKDDYPNRYHLAEKTIKFFRLIGWSDSKIKEIFAKGVVKTNFYHLATENITDLKKVLNDIDQSDDYFKKSAEFSIQLINILQPKVIILEGKSVFNNIVKECYCKNVWNDKGFGYHFDEENNSHILGYSRGRDFSNDHRSFFIEKLKEILE